MRPAVVVHGRVLTDTGDADPRLAAALLAGDRAEVLAALVDARVFAGMRAAATGEHLQASTGLRAESSAEMSVLLLEASGGARALPVCLDLVGLRRWRLDARPVRLTGPEAAAAALEQGLDALVLDPAGAAWTLDGPELRALAEGWVAVPGAPLATRTAEVELTTPRDVPAELVTALGDVLRAEHLTGRLLAGPDGLVLGIVMPLDAAALAALSARLRGRLGPVTAVTAVGPRGAGLGLPSSRFRFGRAARVKD